ncbi:hypothetical protein MMC27_005227 [Xylographa pallens]|nr:hypothetical protein [Xylographa pallens]
MNATLPVYSLDWTTVPEVAKLLEPAASTLLRFPNLVIFLYDRHVQALVLSFIMLILLRTTTTRHSVLEGIPWTGVDGRTFFPRTRATLRSVLQNREHLEEGFRKFSRHGIPFILPNLLTGPDVILPRSQVQWLLDQPSSILSQAEVNRYFLEADYTMLHPNIVRDTVHERVIRAHLQKQLECLTDDIMEELTLQLDRSWGLDTGNWKIVPVFDSMTEVFYSTINRVLVGLPLCRDEKYLYHNSRVFQYCLFVAGLINLTPSLFKPLLAPFITILDRYHYSYCARKVEPLIRSRMEALRYSGKLSLVHKNDYIQWAINDTMDHPDPYERSPEMISKRLAVLQFAAIITSIITMTNTLFDLVSSPMFSEYWADLREEVEGVLAEEAGFWTHHGTTKMVRMDSAIKESLRMGGVVSRGLMKKVVIKEGIRLPGGIHLPYGVQVGVSSYTTQRDETIYPDPDIYNASRFCQGGFGGKEVGNMEPLLESTLKPTPAPARDMYAPFVKTTETFMAFSHGRHACPGRFFAASQLKLALAYIVLNYDVEPIPVREPHLWFVNSIAPPMKATLRIKRRKGTA